MSNIIKSKDDLILVKEIFELLEKEDICASMLEDIVKILLPKDVDGNLLVGYEICEENGGFSRFSFSENSLKLSVDELCRWVEFNSKKLINRFNVSEVSLFKDYMKLLVLVHEVEHSYQYLMAYGVVNSPCDIVSSGYKLIIDTLLGCDCNKMGLIKEIKNRISFNRYYQKCDEFVIERNAHVESFDLLQQLSILKGHEELSNVFNNMRNLIAVWGYVNGNRGSFEETCNYMLIGREYRKLNHDYELSEIERFRYGLPISEDTRDKIRILGKMK